MGVYNGLVCLPMAVPDIHDHIDHILAARHADGTLQIRRGEDSWWIGAVYTQSELAAVREIAAARARAAWQFWQDLLEVYSPPTEMAELRGQLESEPTGHIRDRLEAEYRAQPAINELYTLAGLADGSTVFDAYPHQSRLFQRTFVSAHDLVRHFDITESQLLAAERTRVFATDVFLTQTGRCIETPQPCGPHTACLAGGECFDLSVLQPYYALIDEYLSVLSPESLTVSFHYKL